LKQLEDIGGFGVVEEEVPQSEYSPQPDAVRSDLDELDNAATQYMAAPQEGRQAQQAVADTRARVYAEQDNGAVFGQEAANLHAQGSLPFQQTGLRGNCHDIVLDEVPKRLDSSGPGGSSSSASVDGVRNNWQAQPASSVWEKGGPGSQGMWRSRLSAFWGVDAGVDPKRSSQNPTTMVTQIKGCRSWEDILQMVQTEGLADGVDLSTALHRLSNLVGEDVFSLAADDLEALKAGVQSILQRLLVAVKQQIALKRQQTVSITLLSLARLHFRPDERTMGILCDIGLSCAHKYTPQAIANTMCALVLLGATEAGTEGAELLNVLTDRALSRVCSFELCSLRFLN
jgi:hypothetical protein